jgi:cobaltochelatase CobN
MIAFVLTGGPSPGAARHPLPRGERGDLAASIGTPFLPSPLWGEGARQSRAGEGPNSARGLTP